jgi:hypothetical protein
MVIMFRSLLFALTFCYATSTFAAKAEEQPIRILFIGNSYTYYNDMPLLLEDLAAESGVARPVETETIAYGRATLKDHWSKGQAQAAIAGKHWDYVVLQEHSQLPLRDLPRTRQYVRLFNDKIKASGARTILYLTWARAFAPSTQASLDEAYENIARDIRAAVAPVGPAWQIARREWRGIRLYESDASHPTLAGSYLAAYVLHVSLFGQLPDESSVPDGLTTTEHKVLLKAAAKASLGTLMNWRPTQGLAMSMPCRGMANCAVAER